MSHSAALLVYFVLPRRRGREREVCTWVDTAHEPKIPLHGSGAPGLGAGGACQARCVLLLNGAELVRLVPRTTKVGTGLCGSFTCRTRKDRRRETRQSLPRRPFWAGLADNAGWNGSHGPRCTTEVRVAGAGPARSGKKTPSKPRRHRVAMSERSWDYPRNTSGRLRRKHKSVAG